MNFIKLISLLLLLFANIVYSTTNSNTKNITLFFRDSNKYLLPYIEQKLKNLITIHDSLMFTNVTCINNIKDDIESQKYIGKLVDMLNLHNNSISYIKSTGSKDSLLTCLKKSGYLLTVNINVLQDVLEYQFNLYKINYSDSTKVTDSTKVDFNFVNTQDFLINLSAGDYENKIDNALKSLFPDSTNSPPIAQTRVNQIKLNGYYYYALGDTITVDGKISIDRDTPKKYFKYIWRQLNSYDTDKGIDIPDTLNIGLKEDVDIQRFILNKTGDYSIELQVLDGISKSKLDTVKIRAFKRPKLILDENMRLIANQRGIFPIKKKRIIKNISLKLSNYDSLTINFLEFKTIKFNLPAYKLLKRDELRKILSVDYQANIEQRYFLNNCSVLLNKDSLYNSLNSEYLKLVANRNKIIYKYDSLKTNSNKIEIDTTILCIYRSNNKTDSIKTDSIKIDSIKIDKSKIDEKDTNSIFLNLNLNINPGVYKYVFGGSLNNVVSNIEPYNIYYLPQSPIMFGIRPIWYITCGGPQVFNFNSYIGLDYYLRVFIVKNFAIELINELYRLKNYDTDIYPNVYSFGFVIKPDPKKYDKKIISFFHEWSGHFSYAYNKNIMKYNNLILYTGYSFNFSVFNIFSVINGVKIRVNCYKNENNNWKFGKFCFGFELLNINFGIPVPFHEL